MRLKIPCQKVVDLLIVRHLPEIGIYLNLVVKLLVKQLQLVPILANLKGQPEGDKKLDFEEFDTFGETNEFLGNVFGAKSAFVSCQQVLNGRIYAERK